MGRGSDEVLYEYPTIESAANKNPLNGRWTFISVVVAVVLGLASLLIFLTPHEITDAFWGLNVRDFALSLLLFFLGCLLTAERWRACLGYRAGRREAFHTMGVCHAGNLLIPGRIGEPLRVFLLAELDVPAEYGTSAVVQERMADQVLRVVFLLFVLAVAGGSGLGSRLVGVGLATIVLIAVCVALIRNKDSVASTLGDWLGRLPKLSSETVSGFVKTTLSDLGSSWKRPGGKAALVWGFLAWLIFAAHTDLILRSYFASGTLAFSLLILAVSPPTAPTQPGLFHGMALAAILMLGGDKVPALQAAIVIHMMQMVVFGLWGIGSWFAVAAVLRKRRGVAAHGVDEPAIDPAVEA